MTGFECLEVTSGLRPPRHPSAARAECRHDRRAAVTKFPARTGRPPELRGLVQQPDGRLSCRCRLLGVPSQSAKSRIVQRSPSLKWRCLDCEMLCCATETCGSGCTTEDGAGVWPRLEQPAFGSIHASACKCGRDCCGTNTGGSQRGASRYSGHVEQAPATDWQCVKGPRKSHYA
jgi:hypothetical protein